MGVKKVSAFLKEKQYEPKVRLSIMKFLSENADVLRGSPSESQLIEMIDALDDIAPGADKAIAALTSLDDDQELVEENGRWAIKTKDTQ